VATDDENSLIICLVVSTQYWCMTDRQTDRLTFCDSIVRGMRTRRAVKTGWSHGHWFWVNASVWQTDTPPI